MRGTVLVVVDQQLPRQALSTVLEEAGYSVVDARDGMEGYDVFVNREPGTGRQSAIRLLSDLVAQMGFLYTVKKVSDGRSVTDETETNRRIAV